MWWGCGKDRYYFLKRSFMKGEIPDLALLVAKRMFVGFYFGCRDWNIIKVD